MQDTSSPTLTDEKAVKQPGQLLCLACGLCCDGTICSSVTLDADDDIAPLTAGGIQIVLDGNPPTFRQPCAAYKNCICTVYKDRPRNCRGYECRLLQRYKSGAVSQNEALRNIRTAAALRDEVKRQMLAASGDNEWHLDAFSEGLEKIIKTSRLAAANLDCADLFRSFVALQSYLDCFFRKKPMMPWSTPPSPKKN